MKGKVDWFILGLGVATALAWLWPEPGAAGGWLHPGMLTKTGVALIFFLHGVGLSFGALKSGALHWRLHVVVQATTFVVFPVIGLAINAALGDHIAPDLKTGIFFLCALPSTVSSSVAMTAAAGGNVAAAVFNATLSSIIGIVLTPLWIGAVMNVGGNGLALGAVVLDLVRWLLLPLVVGQLCRPWFGGWVGRHKAGVGIVDRSTILVLIYTSFCDSFKQHVWSTFGVTTVVIVVVAAGALFAFVMVLTARMSDMARFKRADKIAAMFCGSKKTIASGIPMAKLIFGATPGLGMILLPIMIYHPLQLIVCGMLVNSWKRKAHEAK